MSLHDTTDDGLSVRQRVYQFLHQRIVTGEYPGGLRLVEEMIATELGVSRTPVREALQRLTSDGLVQRIRRGHLVVVDIDETTRAEINQLRIAFDQVAARMLVVKAAKVDWEGLYAKVDGLAAVLEESDIRSPRYALAHRELHHAINLQAFAPTIGSLLVRHAFLYPAEVDVQRTVHEPVSQHRRLLDELSSGHLERAVAAMRLHALSGRGNVSAR